MIINVKTDRARYFYQALRILQLSPAFSSLNESEVTVLAQLLAHRDQLRQNGLKDEQTIGDVLFGKKVKPLILKALGISDAGYRNYIHHLKVKGFIDNHRIKLPYQIEYLSEIVFTFANGTEKRKELLNDNPEGIQHEYAGTDHPEK